MVLTRVLVGVGRCQRVVWRQCRRNIGVTAPCYQQMAMDPIQKMFLDKVKDYAVKSQSKKGDHGTAFESDREGGAESLWKFFKSAGGKLVDATPQAEKALTDELAKIARIYGADKQDMTQFPTFSFTDPDLGPVGVDMEVKDITAAAAEEVGQEEDMEDKLYWEL